VKPGHAAGLVLRPLLIALGVLAIAYVIGGPGLFTPTNFVGFLLFAIVTALAFLCGLGAVHNEHKHVNATASLSPRNQRSRHSLHNHVHREPPIPFYAYGGSGLPPGYNSRPDTPDKVMNFTRRVFRNR
jgi:hypothetical protein